MTYSAKMNDNSVNLKDGDRIAAKDGETFYIACCDCSLVHKCVVSVKGKRITLEISRDKRRTTRERRRNRITMIKESE